MNRHAYSIVLGMFFLFSCARDATAADHFYKTTLDKLNVADLPRPSTRPVSQQHAPTIVLDGEGEIFLGVRGPFERYFASWEIDAQADGGPRPLAQTLILARLPKAGPLAGRVIWPDSDGRNIVVRRFNITIEPDPAAAREFHQRKAEYFDALLNSSIEGAAWFRHQRDTARGRIGQPAASDRVRWTGRGQTDLIAETFDIFSGGRAVSENLQLDRAFPATRPDNPTVPLADIPGVSTRAMDFAPLIKEGKPALDPLASLIPADQHAIFFPSFAALTAASDEANLNITAAAKMGGVSTIEPNVRQRYERQLGLPLTTLGRLLGPALIDGVAITGSDPYFLVGTDVAVIFQARNPAALLAAVCAQGQIQIAGRRDVRQSPGKTTTGVDYAASLSADRSVCSYTAAIGNAVIVTNSLSQLERLAATTAETSLASAPEYTFFRLRYPRTDGDETALAVLTDAAIRRWCSPRWRIADSRRTLAAALLSELQARAIDRQLAPGVLAPEFANPDAGEIRLDDNGLVTSQVYNTLLFMTPIIELEFDKVTRDESNTYTLWRNGYQRNWTNFFDPLALRLSISPEKLGADLTIMPLIEGSQYRWLIDLTAGAKLTGRAGDRHEALLQVVAALNPRSPDFKQYGNMIKTFTGNLRIDPLAWVGDSASISVDDDPFWDELVKAENKEDFMTKNAGRLPVALWVRNADSLKLAAFMAMARGFIDQSAPGLLAWETLNHNDQPYVKVSATPKARAEQRGIPDMAIFYAATPGALIVTPSEPLLKRALDRQAAPPAPGSPDRPWPGDNAALSAGRKLLDLWLTALNDQTQNELQQTAWNNIPILNEWKRLFPKQNPADIHERYWHIRLSDPLGGGYDWCDEHATMQSTAFGHPGHAKTPPAGTLASHPLLRQLQKIEAGLTFEHDGLRAKVEVQRSK